MLPTGAARTTRSDGRHSILSMMFSLRARSRTSGLSTPAMWILGNARFNAKANEPPLRPVPTIVTRSIALHHGALDRGRYDVELRHQFAELRRIERLRPVT